jgi:hypothetical protein
MNLEPRLFVLDSISRITVAGDGLQQFTGQYWKLRRNKLNAYTERPNLLFVEKEASLLNTYTSRIDLDETSSQD